MMLSKIWSPPGFPSKFYLAKTINIQNIQNCVKYFSVSVSLINFFVCYNLIFVVLHYCCCPFVIKFQVK